MWKLEALRKSWCRRDSVLGVRKHPHSLVAIPPAALRRSHRMASRTTRLGDAGDPKEIEGEEESAETRTTDEYSPGKFREPCAFWVLSLVVASGIHVRSNLSHYSEEPFF